MSNRRRYFSSNTELTMSDHIRNVANNNICKIDRRGCNPIPQNIQESNIPVTILDGITSYIYLPAPDKNSCQLNKICLYPYGSFYPQNRGT